MINKQPLVIFIDKGLVGTFVEFIEKSTETGYKYLKYVPLNSFKPVILETAIHTDHIHHIDFSGDEKGIEKTIKLIYVGDANSPVKKVIDSENEELIYELREKIRKLKMQIASLKQSESDARTGVSKTISQMKNVNKSTRNPNPFAIDDYGIGGTPPPQSPNQDSEYNEFEF